MVLDSGEPWVLEDFQAAILEDVFAGTPEVWAVIPEGNAKTTLLAGVNLYFADFTPTGECLVAAASREQAEIMFRQAEGLVYRSPGFEGRFSVFPGYRKIVAKASRGVVQIKAADDRTGDGAIPDLATIDELHRQRDMRLYRTWRGKLDKRGGQILGISTAGTPESEFEAARARMHAEAEVTERDGAYTRSASAGVVLHDWRLTPGDDVEDLEVVKAANPLKAITVEVLGRRLRSPTMTPAHWARFVCNMSVDVEGSWITPEAWDACAGDVRLDEAPRVFVGVDIGRKKDSTAIVTAGMVDGSLHVRAQVRTPRPGTPVAVADARADILDVAREFDVAEVIYDPWSFTESAEILRDEGLEVVEFPQTDSRMAPASESLYELIMSGRLVHDGDPVLRSHVLAAVAAETERGVRISKRKSRQQIDSAVALAMAAQRALFAEQAGWSGPLVEVFG